MEKIQQSSAFKDYYNTVQKAQNEPVAPAQVAPALNDSFKKAALSPKKSKKGLVVAATIVITTVTLGVLAKKGKLGDDIKKFTDKIFKSKNTKGILDAVDIKTDDIGEKLIKNTNETLENTVETVVSAKKPYVKPEIKITEKTVDNVNKTTEEVTKTPALTKKTYAKPEIKVTNNATNIPSNVSDDIPVKIVDIDEVVQSTITPPKNTPIVMPQRVVEISEEAQYVDKLFKDNPNAFQLIDDCVNNQGIYGELAKDLRVKPGTTWGEILKNSIRESGKKIDGDIFHGTSPKAKESILKDGFDLKYVGGGESGRGFYFGFDKKSIDAYVQGGGAMIKAKVPPNMKIGEINSGYTTITNTIKICDVDLIMRLQKTLGINIADGSKTGPILDEYMARKFSAMGYDGIITGSTNAGCNYLCVFDPKNIQVIG